MNSVQKIAGHPGEVQQIIAYHTMCCRLCIRNRPNRYDSNPHLQDALAKQWLINKPSTLHYIHESENSSAMHNPVTSANTTHPSHCGNTNPTLHLPTRK